MSLSIGLKVLLQASLQVLFGWLADEQLPSSPGKWYTESGNFQENISQNPSVRWTVSLCTLISVITCWAHLLMWGGMSMLCAFWPCALSSPFSSAFVFIQGNCRKFRYQDNIFCFWFTSSNCLDALPHRIRLPVRRTPFEIGLSRRGSRSPSCFGPN